MVPTNPKRRLTILMVCCVSLASVVVARAAFVQLLPNARLEHMARRQFQAKVLTQPRRGSILDRNGEPLAVNVEASSLAANPEKIVNKRALAKALSGATDVSYSKILERLSEKKEFVWIKRQLSDDELNRFKKFRLIDAGGDLQNGLWLVRENRRVYPHGELASHVLGHVNVDSDGLEGVELWWNEQLRGKVISVNAIKDALGRPTFIDAEAAKNVQDGLPVALTLDASLQFAVEEELKSAMHRTNSKAGSVIVMNAVTGEILAMANDPAFNPNEKGIAPERRRNRGFTDGFEPGSTLKSVLLAGALTNGSRLTDTVWGERGSFTIQGKKISEAEAHEKFEWLTLKKMIQVSSNIGAAKLALRLGADKYLATLKAFGFGTKTDVGFPGEISGQVPPRKVWQPLSLANIGFGQGVLVTPIQMLRAYSVFLNGGWLVQPTLIKSATENSKDKLKNDAPKRILSQKVSDQVLEALDSVTTEGGTGVKAAIEGYLVSGKTGTAQKIDPLTGRYSRTKHIASFIGFARDVEPKIAVFVSLDEPHGIFYASETAAPFFREVLRAVANRFSFPAKAPVKMATTKDSIKISQAEPVIPGRLALEGSTPGGKLLWKMPSLQALTSREAIRALQGHEFKLEVRGTGLVHHQNPDVGKSIADGDVVRLTLSEP